MTSTVPDPTDKPPTTSAARPTFTPGACWAGVTPCGKPARLYPAGWLCEDHPPAGSKASRRQQ